MRFFRDSDRVAGERRWAMVTMTRRASVGVGLALAACLVATARPTRALTTSDKPASILIWPKIVVDTSGLFGPPTDTVIQLSNTTRSQTPSTATALQKQAHCFYIDGNSHCAANADNPGQVCQPGSSCPAGAGRAACEPGWSETDFDIILTPEQPIGWYASQGLLSPPIATTGFCLRNHNIQCNASNAAQVCGSSNGCQLLTNNLGTGIPRVPEDPFVGALKCIEYDLTKIPAIPDQSTTRNTLAGSATIQSLLDSDQPSVQNYNAVGLLATGATGNTNGTNVLQLGGDKTLSISDPDFPEYEACPQFLILDHYFDDSDFIDNTDLTLVPCGDDFQGGQPGNATAQFIVFNEFEQRFSTARFVDCFFESTLSNIDTNNSSRSIFSFNVAGTLGGQTRITPVGNAATGRGLVGVARKFLDGQGAAYNLFQTADPNFDPTKGAVVNPDIITVP